MPIVDHRLLTSVRYYATVADVAAVTSASANAFALIKNVGVFRRDPSYAGLYDGETAIESTTGGGGWLLEAAGPEVVFSVLTAVIDDLQAQLDNRVVIEETISVLVTLDPAAATANSSSSATATVPGARIGDAAAVFPIGLTDGRLVLSAYVSADDTVTVVFGNPSAGTIDQVSAVYRINVQKYA